MLFDVRHAPHSKIPLRDLCRFGYAPSYQLEFPSLVVVVRLGLRAGNTERYSDEKKDKTFLEHLTGLTDCQWKSQPASPRSVCAFLRQIKITSEGGDLGILFPPYIPLVIAR